MRHMLPDNTDQALPDQQLDDAQLYRQYCGQCHVPPLPYAHKAGEWPQIVATMRQYMANQSKPMPDNAQLGGIIEYLQRYAR